ncbi:MAG: cytochrome b/b6 domain-containing protein [Omnitrophica WOR_2 bacterium]
MSDERKIFRFPIAYRVEHWWLVISFTTLGITGLVQKFAQAGVSKAIIGVLGGIEGTRTIHHIAAIALMTEVVYHLGAVIYRLYVRHYRPSMLPTLYDLRAAFQTLLFNIGIVKNRPQEGRYNFENKLEYFAVVWGTIIMVITGFMMWNPLATTRFLPGQFIPAAKAAHGGEALLAVLSIIIWHLYNVLVRHFNKSMFNGYVSEELMNEEHPLELADIKAGASQRPVLPQRIARRKQIFFPLYGVVAAGMLFGIYKFVNLEQTAITTVPPAENVVIFAPYTPTPLPTLPPSPTPEPTQAGSTAQASGPSTWEGGIGAIFEQKCSGCHGASTQMNGLNLSSYQSALTGGQSGPGIVPGNSDGSEIMKIQSAGNHPGQLTQQEIDLIKTWIQAGAIEK